MSVITAADVERARDVLLLANGDVVTPLARDRAKELGIRLERGERNGTPRPTARDASTAAFTGLPPAGGAPSLTAADVQTHRRPPRSGALYRRGGYGLDGQRAQRDAVPRADRPRIAIVGAGHVGAAAAVRLAESDAFDSVTLVDVVDGLAAGLALDISHSAGLQRFTTRVAGSTAIESVAGADIVVVTAGRPRKPGMSRLDLTAANAAIVRAVAPVIRERAPDAVVVVVTNPLEEMTDLMARLTGFPPERVIGMGGVLDTARFRALVGATGVAPPERIEAIVLGSHGDEMVIPLSAASAGGVPLEDLLDAATLEGIVRRTRESGAEVTRLLVNGSAYVSPGAAIARQIEALVRGSDDVVPVCAAANGAYGIADGRVGLPVRLGPGGVREIVELPLRAAERQALRDAAARIRERTRALG